MDPRRVIQHVRLIGLLACLPSLSRVTHAQSGSSESGAVRLQVRSAGGIPLVGAQLRLVATDPWIESDERGLFAVARVPAGNAWLRVRRIGYRPDSMLIVTSSSKTLDTMITMERVAVDLAPVTVLGRRNIQGPMAGFYRRQATGSGRFFTRAEIERRAPYNLTDLLRGIPGVRINSRLQSNSVRIRGSRCNPLVWLDGQGLFATDIDLDALDPMSFDGVEVYSTASVPVEFQGNQRASSSCGTILLWTRQGEARKASAPKRKNGEPSPAAKIAMLLDEQRVFTAADVDSVARIDSQLVVRPGAGVEPGVLLEALVEVELRLGDGPEIGSRGEGARGGRLRGRLLHAGGIDVIDAGHRGSRHHLRGDLPPADIEQPKPFERQLDAPLVAHVGLG